MEALPGLEAHEVVIDFIHNSYKHFSSGIFWINCEKPELINHSIDYIEKVSYAVFCKFKFSKGTVSPEIGCENIFNSRLLKKVS